MGADSVIFAMILICAGFLMLLVLAKPIRFLLKVTLNSVIGVFVLTAANLLLQPMGIYVWINILTPSIVGFLGLPGVLLLLAAGWML